MISKPDRLIRVLSLISSAVILALVAAALVNLGDQPGGLTETVNERIEESGVAHPITAVLLNFRAYDTWLEVAVLLLAAWGVLVLRKQTGIPEQPAAQPAGSVLSWLIRILIPLAVATGVYLLWLGTEAPGGAFQAGAVIGAAGVLLRLSGFRSLGVMSPPMLRASLMAGFAGFLGIATILYIAGWGFLQYPPEQAGLLILIIELLITWSVAVSFVTFFVAARPQGSEENEAPR